MPILNVINQTLSAIKELHHKEIDKFLLQNSYFFNLKINNTSLVKIDAQSIFLLNEDLTQKLFLADSCNKNHLIENNNLKNFLEATKDSIVRLNHLGINYSCPSIDRELKKIKETIVGRNFKLYEELNDFPDQRWFFIGDKENWEQPLFELAITESATPLCSQWTPHFQIDIDTNLVATELESLANKHLEDNFFTWKLDTPNYGLILEMGELVNINGTKICLGIGTTNRDTKIHREKNLQLI
ncbi:MAG: hypothetical protein WC682_00940 [Parcubacteria group bacterium]|jgi:hypothetical protein